jgi:hypothetical protein
LVFAIVPVIVVADAGHVAVLLQMVPSSVDAAPVPLRMVTDEIAVAGYFVTFSEYVNLLFAVSVVAPGALQVSETVALDEVSVPQVAVGGLAVQLAWVRLKPLAIPEKAVSVLSGLSGPLHAAPKTSAAASTETTSVACMTDERILVLLRRCVECYPLLVPNLGPPRRQYSTTCHAACRGPL